MQQHYHKIDQLQVKLTTPALATDTLALVTPCWSTRALAALNETLRARGT